MTHKDASQEACLWQHDKFEISQEESWLFGGFSTPGFSTSCGLWVGYGFYRNLEDKSVCNDCGKPIMIVGTPEEKSVAAE